MISIFMMLLPTNMHMPETEYYGFVDEYLYLQSTAMKQAKSISFDAYGVCNVFSKDSPLHKDSFNSCAIKLTKGFSLISNSIFIVCIVEMRTLTHSRKYLANSAEAF